MSEDVLTRELQTETIDQARRRFFGTAVMTVAAAQLDREGYEPSQRRGQRRLPSVDLVLYGAHEAVLGSESWPKMSGFELSVGLDDEQIAALCTYVRSSWGNRAGPVDAAAVAKQR